MNEIKTTKLLTIVTVAIFVTALATMPYQSQVANAAAGKKYQVYVTLVSVPTNAEDLRVNATLLQGSSFVSNWPGQTVSSPTNGDTVKFILTVPVGSNPDTLYVCGNTADFSRSTCELDPLPSKGGGPIRVEYTYPQPR